MGKAQWVLGGSIDFQRTHLGANFLVGSLASFGTSLGRGWPWFSGGWCSEESLEHPAPPNRTGLKFTPQICCSWKSCKEEIALLSCILMVQVIEMNQEIKCKNPTTEKVVLAGWVLFGPCVSTF